MKKNFLPALIMLIAGAIDCVLSLIQGLPALVFTKRLLLVLLIFFALGTVIQWVVTANFSQMEDDGMTEPEAEADGMTEEEYGPAGDGQEEIENINEENSNE